MLMSDDEDEAEAEDEEEGRDRIKRLGHAVAGRTCVAKSEVSSRFYARYVNVGCTRKG